MQEAYNEEVVVKYVGKPFQFVPVQIWDVLNQDGQVHITIPAPEKNWNN